MGWNMKAMLTFLSLMSIVLTAQPYERDTHLRMTYHLARSVGINDSVAKFLAIGNQHIDEGVVSSPMLLSSQRHLFHFTGDITKVEIEGHGAISAMGSLFKAKLALNERNHPLGSYLIYQGLVKGDLLLVSLGLHVKMDTYGHAGFSNLLGHMDRGHNPDRAFLEPAKYEDMIRSIVQSLVALKKVLPPEALDEAASLKYLNQFSVNTYLQRELTLEDLQDPTRISSILLADKELQGIFREDMFRKYEYKLIGLKKIYTKFKASGVIHANVTFDMLFPDKIIRNTSMDTTDTIKYVIMTNVDSEFLQVEGGADIFELKNLFGFKSTQAFKQKFELEKKRFSERLKELKFIEVQYAANEKSLVGHDLERLAQERSQLLAGLQSSAQYELFSDDFISRRASELAEILIANEISLKLTKDLIPLDPRKYSEYVKQNFEGNTDNRNFEVQYKDEAYRLKFFKEWGVNWVLQNKVNIFTNFKAFFDQFKGFIKKTATAKIQSYWEILASKAANEYMDIDGAPSRARAEIIGFDKASRRDAFLKLAKYAGPAIPLIIGYKYTEKLLRAAKAHAKDHEVEDMDKAISDGKYAKDILATKYSKKAAINIATLKAKAQIRCELLFN